MTKIDRYIFVLFARTILICFCSLAGVFVVFHAFNHLDDIAKQATNGQAMPLVLASYYGPYMLMIFDWTASIITLIAMLFTVGWLRRSGELTALLAAGVNHGRILRPMIVLSLLVVIVQLVNREVFMPRYRDLLTTKPGELASENPKAILPSYDKSSAILIEGSGLRSGDETIEQPTFRLRGAYTKFGDMIVGTTAQWIDANELSESGYLIREVSRPSDIDQLGDASTTVLANTSQRDGIDTKPAHMSGPVVIRTSLDTPWLKPRECFVVTTLHPEVLRDNPRSTRMAGMPELVRRLRNPSVHSSDALRVLLHERIIRGPLDFCLVLLGLPLVVTRNDQRLFGVIAQAMGIVLLFFGLKTLAGGMGSSGYLLSPAMAAWVPLLILGPLAFARYRDVRTL